MTRRSRLTQTSVDESILKGEFTFVKLKPTTQL